MSSIEDHPLSNESNWKSDVAGFLDARLQLAKHESQEAKQIYRRFGIVIGIGLLAALAAWFLFTAGLIGWLATATHLAWWAWAFFLGIFYAIIAFVALLRVKRPLPATFTLTRNELLKDREWLKKL